MEEEIKSDEKNVEITEPIIINLGKQNKKRIKNLLKGRGKLLYEIDDVVEEVTSLLGEELEGKAIVPLVLVYQEKPKQKRSRGMFGL
ncbi:MAG: hypothetical protein MUO62_04890 [Anaerolineales bacterium]|jgi:hypothetical protein|nr:hypothetical protein [Anaerolineales bacterium]